MHPYSTYSARWKMIGIMMIISVVISDYLQEGLVVVLSALPFLQSETVPPGLPTFTIFSILYFLWNHYLWAWPVIRRFTAPPDLRGVWEGGLASSYEQSSLDEFQSDGGEEEPRLPKMKIKQSWTNIKVSIEFYDSESTSTTASFIQDMTDPVLRITYRNRPKGTADEAMVMHEGTNDLRYTPKSESGDILQGKYYTDEHRNNHGQVRFRRAEKPRIAKFFD